MLIESLIRNFFIKRTKIPVYQERTGNPRFTSYVPEKQIIKLLEPPEIEANEVLNSIYRINFSESKKIISAKAELSILENALCNDINLKYSCTMGGCGACKINASGKINLKAPNCLTKEEIDNGIILACVSYPKGDITIAA